MKKTKYYYNSRFPADVISQAHKLLLSKLDSKQGHIVTAIFSVSSGEETWGYDSIEEFLAEYPRSQESFLANYFSGGPGIEISSRKSCTVVTVNLASRADIQSIFQVFETNIDRSTIALEAEEPVKIFIGHGQDIQWRDLKDHLHDFHGFDVTHYEVGPRAGLTVKEVLESMLTESSFALLVLTAEDIHSYGEAHARENVVHELGLFQGRLGFTRAIVVLEKGVSEFSNIFGLNQIRFSKGNIRETYGEVLATLKREFEEDD